MNEVCLAVRMYRAEKKCAEEVGILASLSLAGTGQRERHVFRVAINRLYSQPDTELLRGPPSRGRGWMSLLRPSDSESSGQFRASSL